ncbi:hypothetical protein [Candidatus Electrothrix sp.]|uniref:hypothetical protein n=1 Tax=Candidatus Electrothrix sp. TaxID=2170559 RepID=UPI0040567B88
MDKCIDHSIGKTRYTMTIMTNGARQARVMPGKEDRYLEGEFILTAGKKIIILTQDQKPVIVKRWKVLNLKRYLEDNYPFGSASYPNIAKIYQDSDGWLWQKMNDNISPYGHFTVLKDDEILYTIFLS